MTEKLLSECTDEEILCITGIVIPASSTKREQRLRRSGATLIWTRKESGRLRFRIPLKFGMYYNTALETHHLVLNTGWPQNTVALLADKPEPVRLVSGSKRTTFEVESIEDLDLQ
jgi:hypothetical protein